MPQVVTLLLHQQNVGEALQQFRAHVGWLRAPPLPLPPAAAAAHALWLQRQYGVMGELLSTRIDAGLLPGQVRSRCNLQCSAAGTAYPQLGPVGRTATVSAEPLVGCSGAALGTAAPAAVFVHDLSRSWIGCWVPLLTVPMAPLLSCAHTARRAARVLLPGGGQFSHRAPARGAARA